MQKVITGKCDSYDVEKLKHLFYQGFEQIDFRAEHQKVLLKPNLLSGKPPEKAVTTHPQFIRAISELLLDCGCHVSIGDSPGYESTENVLSKSGIMDIVKSKGLKIVHFNNKITKKSQGISPYMEFIFGEDPDSFDAVINLPKLKTHVMMGLTLGVKNTFGFIHGMDKAKWHLRAGIDRKVFAAMLIDIHNIVRPTITVLDGIIGMDKEGPGNGRVRNMGIVAMSRNTFALDHRMECLLGLSSPLPISVVAKEHGMIPEYEAVYLDSPAAFPVDFEMPAAMATDWGLPGLVRRTLKAVFVKKPKVRKQSCRACEVCARVCPAGAITVSESLPIFDYRKCIRCYCCQEMCPEGAIGV